MTFACGDARKEPPLAVYVPESFDPRYTVSVVMKTDLPPATQANAARQVMRGLDPELPLYSVAPVAKAVGEAAWQFRFFTFLLSAFAGLAVLLASVGLGGIMASMVVERTQEIGVRMAVGASAEPRRANGPVARVRSHSRRGRGGNSRGFCSHARPRKSVVRGAAQRRAHVHCRNRFADLRRIRLGMDPGAAGVAGGSVGRAQGGIVAAIYRSRRGEVAFIPEILDHHDVCTGILEFGDEGEAAVLGDIHAKCRRRAESSQ